MPRTSRHQAALDASNDEVAQRLGFNDITNFRRSFKRWTGRVPSELGGLLCR